MKFYCTYTRGPEFSRNFNDIIEEANNLVNSGQENILVKR